MVIGKKYAPLVSNVVSKSDQDKLEALIAMANTHSAFLSTQCNVISRPMPIGIGDSALF